MCFKCSSKGHQSYNIYKNLPMGFIMLFCHVFIDAPEKLTKFRAFSTLGTALIWTSREFCHGLGQVCPERAGKAQQGAGYCD